MGVAEWINIAMVAATVVLAAGTFWMAVATREMADAANKTAFLEGEPHLAMLGVKVAFEDGGQGRRWDASQLRMQFSLDLRNPGKVLVQYRVEDIGVTFEELELKEDGVSLNRGGVIHPGTSTSFFHPPFIVSKAVGQPVKARIRYRIRYWAVGGDERETRAVISAEVRLPPNGGGDFAVHGRPGLREIAFPLSLPCFAA